MFAQILRQLSTTIGSTSSPLLKELREGIRSVAFALEYSSTSTLNGQLTRSIEKGIAEAATRIIGESLAGTAARIEEVVGRLAGTVEETSITLKEASTHLAEAITTLPEDPIALTPTTYASAAARPAHYPTPQQAAIRASRSRLQTRQVLIDKPLSPTTGSQNSANPN